jgi:hypothetical protein
VIDCEGVFYLSPTYRHIMYSSSSKSFLLQNSCFRAGLILEENYAFMAFPLITCYEDKEENVAKSDELELPISPLPHLKK